VLGIFVLTSQGQSGSTLYMFNHGISTAALFLVTGFLIRRRGSAMVGDFGGVDQVAPVLAGIFLVAGLSSLSLPGLAPFVSEFLVLAGTSPGRRPLRSSRRSASSWPRSTSSSSTSAP
jgi:NADH-quinone oxidoreductase subunit M